MKTGFSNFLVNFDTLQSTTLKNHHGLDTEVAAAGKTILKRLCMTNKATEMYSAAHTGIL